MGIFFREGKGLRATEPTLEGQCTSMRVPRESGDQDQHCQALRVASTPRRGNEGIDRATPRHNEW